MNPIQTGGDKNAIRRTLRKSICGKTFPFLIGKGRVGKICSRQKHLAVSTQHSALVFSGKTLHSWN
jgi:hypothetical protein